MILTVENKFVILPLIFATSLVMALASLGYMECFHPEYDLLLLSFVILSISLMLGYRAGASIIHPIFLTLMAFLLYFGIGLAMLGIDKDNFIYLFSFSLGMIAFSMGALLVNRLLKIIPSEYLKKMRSEQFSDINMPSNWSLYLLWGCGFLAYAYLILKIGIPSLSGDPYIRYNIKGFHNSLFEIFWLLSCIGFFVKSQKLNEKRALFLSFFFIFITIILFSALLHRYAALQLLLALLIAYASLKKISLRTGFIWFAFSCGFIVGLQVMRSYLWGTTFESVENLWSTTVNRIFLIGAKTYSFVLDVFPRHIDFMWGLTYIRRIRNLYFPEDIMPSMGYFLYSSVVGSKVPGYDPLSIMNEFYINFGIPGIILGMMFFGALTQWFYIVLHRKKTVYRIIFYSVGAMFLVRSFAFSLPGEVFNFLVITLGVALLYSLSWRSVGNIRS